MKKQATLIVVALFCSIWSFAQTTSNTASDSQKEKIKSNIEKPSRDFLVFALTYDNWAKKPEGLNTTGFSRGFSFSLNYDFPISESHFSFAAGLGINSSNIFFKDQVPSMNGTSSQIIFQDVDSADAVYLKKSKMSINYLELPLEIRYFSNKINRNRGFKMALGVHVGLLMNTHTKVKHSAPGMPEVITEKTVTNRYVEKWRFVPSLRIGWGNFSLYGTYSITPLFKEGAGPKVYPYSIGISISGL